MSKEGEWMKEMESITWENKRTKKPVEGNFSVTER